MKKKPLGQYSLLLWNYVTQSLWTDFDSRSRAISATSSSSSSLDVELWQLTPVCNKFTRTHQINRMRCNYVQRSYLKRGSASTDYIVHLDMPKRTTVQQFLDFPFSRALRGDDGEFVRKIFASSMCEFQDLSDSWRSTPPPHRLPALYITSTVVHTWCGFGDIFPAIGLSLTKNSFSLSFTKSHWIPIRHQIHCTCLVE